jgi:hypothetical protein
MRIAALLKLIHHVIGNPVAFFLGQSLSKPSDKLRGTP